MRIIEGNPVGVEWEKHKVILAVVEVFGHMISNIVSNVIAKVVAPKCPDGPLGLAASSTSIEVLGKTLGPVQNPCF